MRALASSLLIRLSIVATLIVALGSIGFAHRTAPVLDADLMAFLNSGGTLADICNDAPDGAEAVVICEACQIAGAANVPSANEFACDAGLIRIVAIALPRPLAVWLDAADPVRLSRAPPVL